MHPMKTRLTLALASVVLAAPAAAQTNEGSLRDKLSSLFIFCSGKSPLFLAGSSDPNNPS